MRQNIIKYTSISVVRLLSSWGITVDSFDFGKFWEVVKNCNVLSVCVIPRDPTIFKGGMFAPKTQEHLLNRLLVLRLRHVSDGVQPQVRGTTPPETVSWRAQDSFLSLFVPCPRARHACDSGERRALERRSQGPGHAVGVFVGPACLFWLCILFTSFPL